jgi:hypothetical protein
MHPHAVIQNLDRVKLFKFIEQTYSIVPVKNWVILKLL